MPYGFQFYDSDGSLLLEISDRTMRLVDIKAVTVPTSGTVTVTVPATSTTSNSIVVTENGTSAQVTATGEVTIYGSTATSGTTNIRVYEF